MENEKYKELKMGERGVYISIGAYLVLSSLKLIVGIISGSAALRADGLNNATDIVASVAVLIGLKLARKPPDADHPYGHWKAETVASLIASFIMMTVGLQVLYTAVLNVFDGSNEAPDMLAAWTGIFGAVVMFGVYRYNMRLGTKINSQSVKAAAKDNLSDALVSIGTVVGIVGSQLGLTWLDPVAAILVGLIICKTAWDIFAAASHQLTDGFDETLMAAYTETILQIQGVKGIKTMKARSYGNNAIVDTEILVNSTLDIRRAHDVATTVEKTLKREHGVYWVNVHVEPQ
ncbi:cation diffusion facilitator family transporter [Terribacillus sp. DMT04]|uniref:cation diffusion facilitator family transporter n=1 Tax=Terribacillus sp. DMT04 TaxID=2850441 RepID=UPI00273829DB|nr:cation diffusion facilitator family transporter [Terribacillus sp. DMT04]